LQSDSFDILNESEPMNAKRTFSQRTPWMTQIREGGIISDILQKASHSGLENSTTILESAEINQESVTVAQTERKESTSKLIKDQAGLMLGFGTFHHNTSSKYVNGTCIYWY